MNQNPVKSPWVKARESRSEVESEKKAAVLRAAAVAFVQHGFHGTTMDRIAGMLGVSKPTIYKYYKNKDQLMHDCIELASARFKVLAEEALSMKGSSIDRLKHYLYGSVAYFNDETGRALLMNEKTGLDPEGVRLWRQRRDEITEIFRAVVQEGMDNHEIDPGYDPKIILLALFAGFNDISVWYKPNGEYTEKEICDQYFEIYFNGLRPKAR